MTEWATHETLSQTKAVGSDLRRGKLEMLETGLSRAGLLGQQAFYSLFKGSQEPWRDEAGE